MTTSGPATAEPYLHISQNQGAEPSAVIVLTLLHLPDCLLHVRLQTGQTAP